MTFTHISGIPPVLSTIYGVQPTGVAIGKFKSSGNADLLIASPTGVYRLPGNGDGTFNAVGSTKISIPSSIGASSIVSGLFPSGSGNLGFAIADGFASTTQSHVELGAGDGTFSNLATQSAIAGPSSMVIRSADLNGDGKPDILTQVGQFIYTQISNGSSYTSGPTVNFGTVPNAVGIGPLKSGGAPAIAVAEGTSVAIYTNNGSGAFSYQPPLVTGASHTITGVALGDLRGTGHADLAFATAAYVNGASWAFDIETASGKGDGTFGGGDNLTIPIAGSIYTLAGFEIDDVTGSGAKRIIALYTDAQYIHLQVCFLNNGGGATILCQDLKAQAIGGAVATGMAWGDVNNDGISDIVVTVNHDDITNNQTFYVFLGEP
jgi:hypothetical protein